MDLHKIKVRDRSAFDESSLKSIIVSATRGISAIIGTLKDAPASGTVSYKLLFDKTKWTIESAKEWAKENANKDNCIEVGERTLKALVETVNAKENSLEVAVATDGGLDRDNEAISTDGWDFKNFKKNPVLLWAHDYRTAPIGKVTNLRKEGNKILFTPVFAVNESAFAQEIFDLFKGGFMNAFSVGFIPRAWTDSEKDGKFVRTFTEAELLEISAVPVPANPRAVVLAREYGANKSIIEQMQKAADDEDEEDIDPLPPEDIGNDEDDVDLEDEEEKCCAQCTEHKATIAALEAKILEISSTVQPGGKNAGVKAPEKVENQDGVLDAEIIARRVLKQVATSVSEALGEIRKARESK